jgi:hypothetical protein
LQEDSSGTMSANIGVVRLNGRIFRVGKTPFETDDRLQDRTWYCALQNPTDEERSHVLVSDSHKWANKKYFNMKYVDNDDRD